MNGKMIDMRKLVERIKEQLEYCSACESDIHAHTTATRIAEMIVYEYYLFDKKVDELLLLFQQNKDDFNDEKDFIEFERNKGKITNPRY